MNRELLTKIAEWLEAGAPHEAGISTFHMNYFIEPMYEEEYAEDYEKGFLPNPIHGCGTACCIAGAAWQFHHKDNPENQGRYLQDCHTDVADLLDLPYNDSHRLFYGEDPEGDTVDLNKVTAEQAAKVIRHLLATGKVDWSISGAEYE
jgi:hypothetical protein